MTGLPRGPLSFAGSAEPSRLGDRMPDSRLLRHAHTRFAEFRRRRVFRVAVVYLIVGWLLVQVADATFEPLGLPPWSPRLLIVLLGAGLRAGLRAGVDLRRPAARHRTHARVAEPIAANGDTPARRATDRCCRNPSRCRRRTRRSRSCRSPTCQRSQRPGLLLRWPGRGNPQRARARARPARRLAHVVVPVPRRQRDARRHRPRSCNVAAIMEGSVRKAGDRVRVTAQLVDASQRLPPVVGEFRPQPRRHLRDPGRDRAQRRQRACGRRCRRRVAFDLQKRRAARHARLRVLPARPPARARARPKSR